MEAGTNEPAAPAIRADGESGGASGRVFYGWWIVTALAITQTVGYGVLFYAFGVATIARPALVAEQYDTIAYGTVSGLLTTGRLRGRTGSGA
ncbi:hypothetical protein SMC26_21295 [Actinomadura fulvescens]|uniref:MFS transporter n=1 Tax=Actinomadura fulvescens TaxID=46160 RepID=A0ABN3PE28_9ACTN